MAEPAIILRSAVAGKAPTTTTLDFGQLAINTSDGIIYYKSQDSAGGTEIINHLGGADSGFANNSLITLSPGSGLLSGGSFTINQSSNEVISFKIDSSVIPTLVGNNTFSGTNTFSALSNQSAELTAVTINGSGTLGTRELDASAFTNTAITTNVTEGTNLYYTGSRANLAIDTRVTQSFVNNLDVDAITLGGNDSSYYLDYNNFANTPDSAGALIEDTTVTLAAGAGLLSGGSFTTNQSAPSTITFKVDSSSIPTLVGGLLDSAAIPSLDIGTDTHGILPLSRTTGTIDSSQIPSLELGTDVIGTIDSSQIPSIDINNDTHSTLDSARIPPLPSPANDATITLSAGNGLITGGSFTTDQAGNVTITHALGTPSTLTSTTTNTVTDSSHTHVIDETGFSIVATQLTGTIDSARLASFDISADTHGSLAYSRVSNTPTIGNGTVTISAGSGLLDGGSFTTNQTGSPTITLKIDSSSVATLTAGLLDSAAIPSLSISTDTHGSLALSRTTGTLDSSQIGSLDINNDTHSTLDSARIPTLQLSSDISGTTTDLSEGTNLYFTNTRSRSAISVTDAGGEGSLAYNSGTGVITYTGPLPSVGAYPLIETAVGITMSQSNHYHVSDSAVTMTLPSADSADRLELSVRNYTNTTVARNGNKIMGLAEDITINVAYSSLTFEFIDSDFGWFVSDTRGDVTVVNSYNGTFDSAQFPSIDINNDTHSILDSARMTSFDINNDTHSILDSARMASFDINNDTHSILDSDRLPPLPSPANDATITLSAGNGLITGGSFTTDQAGDSSITHTLGTPSTLTGSTTNAVTPTSHTHEIDETGFSIATSQLTGTLDSAAIPSLSISTDTHGSLALSRTTGILDSAQIASFDIATDTHGILSLARTSGTLDSSQIPVLSLSSDIDGTTTDLPEGTNLYYTSTRANSAIDTRVTQSFVDALNVNADTLDGQNGTYYLDYVNFTSTPTIGNGTVTIAAGNGLNTGGSFTTNQTGSPTITIDIDSSSVATLTAGLLDSSAIPSLDISSDIHGTLALTRTTGTIDSSQIPVLKLGTDVTGTTDNITEGTNLYFTNARSRSSISVTDTGGEGSLAYNSGTGVITYTGPLPSVGAYPLVETAVGITMSQSNHYHVSDSAVTMTLPSADSADRLEVSVRNFTNTTVARNGNKIMGLAEDIVLNVAYSSLTFEFIDSDFGWFVSDTRGDVTVVNSYNGTFDSAQFPSIDINNDTHSILDSARMVSFDINNDTHSILDSARMASFDINNDTHSILDSARMASFDINNDTHSILDSDRMVSFDINNDTHSILDSDRMASFDINNDTHSILDSARMASFDINNDTHSILDSDRLPILPSPANDATITMTAGNGLITGGSFTTDQAGDSSITHTLGTPSTLTSTTTNAVTAISHTHEIDETGFSIASTQLTGTLDSARLPSLDISADTHGSLAYSRVSNTPTIGNGTLTLNTIGTGLSGSTLFTANQTGGSTFSVTSNATSANTADTIVARDASGNFSAGTITAALTGNASTATTAAAWTTGRTITLTGDVTGISGGWDGSGDISFAATVGNDTHTHDASNLTGNTLAAGVTASSLTSLGTITSLFADTATVGGPSATGANFYVTAGDSAGASSTTAVIHMSGYEGRGIGTRYFDITYPDEQWYSGLPYNGNFNTYQIGYDAIGDQPEYDANYVLKLANNGNLTVLGSITANGSSGSNLYGIALNRSAGTGSPDIWQQGGEGVVIGAVSGTAILRVLPTGIDVVAGGIDVGSTEIVTSGRVLQNVTANASIITAGVLDSARIPTLQLSSDISGTTTDLPEGSNLYHTNARARSAISVTDTGGEGSLAYNSGTGVITYTGPLPSVGAYPLIETAVGIQMVQSNHYHVSDSAQTMTLPAADSADRLELSVRNFTNTTVARNGNKIMGLAEDIILNVAYSSLTFEFIDSDYGWFVSDTRGDVTVVNSYNGTFDSAQFPSIDINNDTHSILDSDRMVSFDINNDTHSILDSDRLPILPSPANDATIILTAGNGLITGGSFTTDQSGNVTITHTLGTPSTLTSTTTNAVTAASHTHLIDESGFSIATSQLTGDVALGTGTSGSYVQQGATSGSGISGSVNSESGTFTVTSNATNLNTASTTVFRDASGNFSAGTITAALTGNASTATTAAAWTTGRTIELTGDVTGTSAAWTGSGNISFAATVGNDTHTHDAGNLTGGTLAAGVIASSLTSVGTLTNLDVDNVNVNGSTVTYNSIAATTAETNTLATITETSIASFTAATYGGGKFVIIAKDGVNRHICELLVTHDGTTVIATQYGSISTAGDLATYDVDINAGSVRILATSASTASTVYNVSETLLAA